MSEQYPREIKIPRYSLTWTDLEQTESEMLPNDKGNFVRVDEISPYIKDLDNYQYYEDEYLNALYKLLELTK